FRVTLVLLAWFGFSIGSGLGGAITAHIFEGHSWGTVFMRGGVLPVCLAPLLWWSLPESLQGLAQRGGHEPQIRATLARLRPHLSFPADASFVTLKKQKGFPVALLFREGRSRVTIPLWIMFFM